MSVPSTEGKGIIFISLFDNIENKNDFDECLIFKLDSSSEGEREEYLQCHILEHYRNCSLGVLSALFDYSLAISNNKVLWGLLNKVFFPNKNYLGQMNNIYEEYFLSTGDIYKKYKLSCFDMGRKYIPASSFYDLTPKPIGRPHYVYSENQPTHKITYEPIINNDYMYCERGPIGISRYSEVDVCLGLDLSVFDNNGQPLLWTSLPFIQPSHSDVENSYAEKTVLLIKSQRYSPSVYGHWLLDWLPEILYFYKSGLFFDILLIPDLPDFAIGIIKVLAPDLLNRLQSYSRDGISFYCKTLLISTSFEATRHPMNFLDPVLLDTLNYFVDIALAKNNNDAECKTKKLYLSRAGGVRSISNDAEISKILLDKGFSIPDLYEMSFLDQVRLFKSADIIIAPHGSALSNIIFCNKGTKILELFPEGYATNCFGVISLVKKYNYTYLVGCDPKKKTPAIVDFHCSSMNSVLLWIQADYYINTEILLNWLGSLPLTE